GWLMDLAYKLIVVALAGAAIWWALQQRYVFVVRIDGGKPRVSRGKVTAAFLQDVAQVCAEGGIAGGWIGGVPPGRTITLTFSGNIPAPFQQRLRNLWSLHG